MRTLVVAGVLALLAGAGTIWGHHSFVVFFDDTKSVTVTGAVTEFKFTNPHAVIELLVKEPQAQAGKWRAETNAVTLLRRRGWTKESLKAGDVITVEGWPSRDGSPYMRVRRVVKADGTVLGAPLLNQRAD